MKNCIKCRKQLEDDVVFCTFCGSNQPDVSDMAVATPRTRDIKALIAAILGFAALVLFEVLAVVILINLDIFGIIQDYSNGVINVAELFEKVQGVGVMSSASSAATPTLVMAILSLVYYFSGKCGKGAFALGIVSVVFCGIGVLSAFRGEVVFGMLFMLGVAMVVTSFVLIIIARKQEGV